MAERAAAIVSGGHSAIVDAVYARPADRQAIEDVATAASVPFVGLWLEAPESVLIARTEQRRNDPSDADERVIRMQREQDVGKIGWHTIDAATSATSVLQRATELTAADPRQV
jgi:predicted kinase